MFVTTSYSIAFKVYFLPYHHQKSHKIPKMKIPAIVLATTYGLAFSDVALSMPTHNDAKPSIVRSLWPRGNGTEWMLKCSHGSCYSMVGCTSEGAVTHNDPSCWQMCTCIAYNTTDIVTGL
ncbi:hypothetical protein J7T55_015683 [Diaporthe amygdali]|uniref:uncharacterized protein n=1 Tax=Phomopsis amygdali TaxID=1214568 RepID=UPI0022FDD731|nr:uncharacterized protein J7T55_015683 [Diaporthe amygdali]KAJ0120944.1 hypothetical protein J7T55_015683 [Diaporthe amygdali]